MSIKQTEEKIIERKLCAAYIKQHICITIGVAILEKCDKYSHIIIRQKSLLSGLCSHDTLKKQEDEFGSIAKKFCYALINGKTNYVISPKGEIKNNMEFVGIYKLSHRLALEVVESLHSLLELNKKLELNELSQKVWHILYSELKNEFSYKIICTVKSKLDTEIKKIINRITSLYDGATSSCGRAPGRPRHDIELDAKAPPAGIVGRFRAMLKQRGRYTRKTHVELPTVIRGNWSQIIDIAKKYKNQKRVSIDAVLGCAFDFLSENNMLVKNESQEKPAEESYYIVWHEGKIKVMHKPEACKTQAPKTKRRSYAQPPPVNYRVYIPFKYISIINNNNILTPKVYLPLNGIKLENDIECSTWKKFKLNITCNGGINE